MMCIIVIAGWDKSIDLCLTLDKAVNEAVCSVIRNTTQNLSREALSLLPSRSPGSVSPIENDAFVSN